MSESKQIGVDPAEPDGDKTVVVVLDNDTIETAAVVGERGHTSWLGRHLFFPEAPVVRRLTAPVLLRNPGLALPAADTPEPSPQPTKRQRIKAKRDKRKGKA